MLIAKIQKSNPKSHWQYASRYFDNALKKFRWFEGLIDPTKTSHVSTAIANADGTLSQAVFAIDLDFDRASDEWKIDGKLNYPAIRDAIASEFPFLEPFLVSVCRSSGMKGLHFVFCFSPFPLGDSRFQKTYDIFHQLGGILTKAFNILGLGADPSAWGTNRLTMNWRNPQYALEFHQEALNNVWQGDGTHLDESGRYRRDNVLGGILKSLREHPLLSYKPKKDVWLEVDSDLLYPDLRVEIKLAKLLVYVWEEHHGDWWTSLQELGAKFGFNQGTLRKLMGMTLPCGLSFERQGREIHVGFNRGSKCKYMIRAQLLSDGVIVDYRESQQERVDIYSPLNLPKPSEVEFDEDGSRNKFIVSVAVWLKLTGVEQVRAEKIIGNMVVLIPGWLSSGKSRDWLSRVESIYRNQRGNYGKLPARVLPQWVLDFENVKSITSSRPSKKDKKFKKVDPGLGRSPQPLEAMSGSCQKVLLEKLQRGQGEPPPVSAEGVRDQAKVLDFLAAFAPQAAQTLRGEKPLAISGALTMDPLNHLFSLTEQPIKSLKLIEQPHRPEPSLKLSEARKFSFGSIDPLERFLASLERCLSRKSESEIFKTLTEAEINFSQNQQFILKGPFRRVLKSYFVISDRMRREVLRNLLALVQCGGDH